MLMGFEVLAAKPKGNRAAEEDQPSLQPMRAAGRPAAQRRNLTDDERKAKRRVRASNNDRCIHCGNPVESRSSSGGQILVHNPNSSGVVNTIGDESPLDDPSADRHFAEVGSDAYQNHVMSNRRTALKFTAAFSGPGYYLVQADGSPQHGPFGTMSEAEAEITPDEPLAIQYVAQGPSATNVAQPFPPQLQQVNGRLSMAERDDEFLFVASADDDEFCGVTSEDSGRMCHREQNHSGDHYSYEDGGVHFKSSLQTRGGQWNQHEMAAELSDETQDHLADIPAKDYWPENPDDPWTDPESPHSKAYQRKNSSLHTEADLLEAMAKATGPEQQRLMGELDGLRAQASFNKEADAAIDFADAYIRDALTPVRTHEHHTAATDWISTVAENNSDERLVQQQMAADASVWAARVSAAVKAEPDEYIEQARGAARVAASGQGIHRDLAFEQFIRTAIAQADVSWDGADAQAPSGSVMPWGQVPAPLPPVGGGDAPFGQPTGGRPLNGQNFNEMATQVNPGSQALPLDNGAQAYEQAQNGYDDPYAGGLPPVAPDNYNSVGEDTHDDRFGGQFVGSRHEADSGSIFCKRCGGQGMVRAGGVVKNCTSCKGTGVSKSPRKKIDQDLGKDFLGDHEGSLKHSSSDHPSHYIAGDNAHLRNPHDSGHKVFVQPGHVVSKGQGYVSMFGKHHDYDSEEHGPGWQLGGEWHAADQQQSLPSQASRTASEAFNGPKQTFEDYQSRVDPGAYQMDRDHFAGSMAAVSPAPGNTVTPVTAMVRWAERNVKEDPTGADIAGNPMSGYGDGDNYDKDEAHAQSGEAQTGLPLAPEGPQVAQHFDFLTDFPDTGPTEVPSDRAFNVSQNNGQDPRNHLQGSYHQADRVPGRGEDQEGADYEPDRSGYSRTPAGQAESTQGYEEAYSSNRHIDYSETGIGQLGTVPVQGYGAEPHGAMWEWNLSNPGSGAANVAGVPAPGIENPEPGWPQPTDVGNPEEPEGKEAKLQAVRRNVRQNLGR